MLYEFVANSLCTNSVIVAVVDIIKIITTIIIITSTKKVMCTPLEGENSHFSFFYWAERVHVVNLGQFWGRGFVCILRMRTKKGHHYVREE